MPSDMSYALRMQTRVIAPHDAIELSSREEVAMQAIERRYRETAR